MGRGLREEVSESRRAIVPPGLVDDGRNLRRTPYAVGVRRRAERRLTMHGVSLENLKHSIAAAGRRTVAACRAAGATGSLGQPWADSRHQKWPRGAAFKIRSGAKRARKRVGGLALGAGDLACVPLWGKIAALFIRLPLGARTRSAHACRRRRVSMILWMVKRKNARPCRRGGRSRIVATAGEVRGTFWRV